MASNLLNSKLKAESADEEEPETEGLDGEEEGSDETETSEEEAAATEEAEPSDDGPRVTRKKKPRNNSNRPWNNLPLPPISAAVI